MLDRRRRGDSCRLRAGRRPPWQRQARRYRCGVLATALVEVAAAPGGGSDLAALFAAGATEPTVASPHAVSALVASRQPSVASAFREQVMTPRLATPSAARWAATLKRCAKKQRPSSCGRTSACSTGCAGPPTGCSWCASVSSAASASSSTSPSTRCSCTASASTTASPTWSAWLVAVLNNFVLNRHWTFDAGDGRARFQAVRFLVVSLVAEAFSLLAADAARARAPASPRCPPRRSRWRLRCRSTSSATSCGASAEAHGRVAPLSAAPRRVAARRRPCRYLYSDSPPLGGSLCRRW